MIKKFNEYIKESKKITLEDVDDQFLRIREILDHNYAIDENKTYFFICVTTGNFKANGYPEYPIEIYDEVNNIKDRVERMYGVKVKVTGPDKEWYLCVLIPKISNFNFKDLEKPLPDYYDEYCLNERFNLFKPSTRKKELPDPNRPFPTQEDIDDQFLRLKEVFDCEIDANPYMVSSSMIAYITIQSPTYMKGYLDPKMTSDVSKEIEQIKNRMESMYKVSVDIYKGTGDIWVMSIRRSELKESIEYNNTPNQWIDDSILSLFPKEEVDDQFLRLVEIYDCGMSCMCHSFNNAESVVISGGDQDGELRWPGPAYGGSELKLVYLVKINLPENPTDEIIKNVSDELSQTKNRIESMFPIKIHINKLRYNCFVCYIEPREITHRPN